jgi:DNA-binding protein HU-beta
MADELVASGEIATPGFGKFFIAVRKARTGLNPETKQKINILETKVPKFTGARALKESTR